MIFIQHKPQNRPKTQSRRRCIAVILTCLAGFAILQNIQANTQVNAQATVKAKTNAAQSNKPLSKTQLESLPASPWHSDEQIANALGWVHSSDSANLCHGYFKQPDIVLKTPSPLAASLEDTTITSDGPTLLRPQGVSILTKNVTVTQLGRISTADKAYIYRNKFGKITHITMIGHAHAWEFGEVITGPKAYINIQNQYGWTENALYHLTSNGPLGEYNAWGHAKYAEKLDNPNDDIKVMHHATFTTCSPMSPTWDIEAREITLDHNKNIGVARDGVLKIKGFPVMYSPYYSFPLSKHRKSGFLFPSFGYSHQNGFVYTQPYYWNMAPNYDMIISPALYTKRGFVLGDDFRYLSHSGQGELISSFTPYDRAYKKFRQDQLNEKPSSAFANRLKNASNTRYSVALTDSIKLNDQWSSSFNINHVSDDYYLEDYAKTTTATPTGVSAAMANQLLNQYQLKYQGLHWNFTGMLQGYQTLHPLLQPSPATDQYEKLPELDLSNNYPGIFHHFNFTTDMQAVDFIYTNAFNGPLPDGQRYHFEPSINLPFNWAWGYFTPEAHFDLTQYEVKPATTGPSSGATDITRTLPIIDIDSGLYFDRHFHLLHHAYTQTLSPQLFYLYVPYTNQNNIPIFDTQAISFGYAQLFALNQYAGMDRIQNANQLSLILNSDILDGNTGDKKFSFGAGMIRYFADRRVGLGQNDPIDRSSYSPLVAQMTYYFWPHWSTTGSMSWDFDPNQFDNATVGLQYQRDSKHVFSTGYEYIDKGDPAITGTYPDNNYSRVNVGFAWPLSSHWSTLNYFYYNLSHRHPESYFFGLQYENCCAIVRFLTSRQYLGIQTGRKTVQNQFSTNYYVEIQLKGLGSVGNANPQDLVASGLPGYQDSFRSNHDE